MKKIRMVSLALATIFFSPGQAYSNGGSDVEGERLRLSSQPELVAFLDRLQALVKKRDAQAFRKLIADDYFVSRDFGGTFRDLRPGWWNFASDFPFASRPAREDESWAKFKQFSGETAEEKSVYTQHSDVGVVRFDDETKEESWKSFAAELPRHYVQASDDDKSFCGEARPTAPLGWTSEDGSMAGETAFTKVKKVVLRASPSLKGKVVQVIRSSDDIVKIISDGALPDPEQTYRWIKVKFDGKKPVTGFVAARLIYFWPDTMLCFGKKTRNGPWQITGLIKGGD